MAGRVPVNTPTDGMVVVVINWSCVQMICPSSVVTTATSVICCRKIQWFDVLVRLSQDLLDTGC